MEASQRLGELTETGNDHESEPFRIPRKNRSKSEIRGDILECLSLGPRPITGVMRGANLNLPRARTYLGEMERSGHVERNPKGIYRVTPEGLESLNEYYRPIRKSAPFKYSFAAILKR